MHLYIHVQLHVPDLDVSPRCVIGGSGWWWRMRAKPRERDPRTQPQTMRSWQRANTHMVHCLAVCLTDLQHHQPVTFNFPIAFPTHSLSLSLPSSTCDASPVLRLITHLRSLPSCTVVCCFHVCCSSRPRPTPLVRHASELSRGTHTWYCRLVSGRMLEKAVLRKDWARRNS
jgi:hypothetical protein